MKKNILYIILILAFASCKKQDEWLDAKSNKADIVPATLQDFQAILDNNTIMNTNYPAIGIIGADNSYVNDVSATTVDANYERNAYKWAADIYEGNMNAVDWSYPYQVVEYANIVLDGIENIKVDPQNQTQINTLKGSALFYRANAFYQLAQLYAKPYIPETAGSDLGIVLRLSSDVNVVNNRATVKETYQQIILDLAKAQDLLPVVPVYKTRPSKLASQLLLAKVYLHMADYVKAKEYADNVIKTNGTLIDLNALNTLQTYPFPNYQSNNPELLFYNVTFNHFLIGTTRMMIASELYNSYDANDLRKTLFYQINSDNTISFRGSYLGLRTIFCGLSINEAYLIRAESQVRTNSISGGMSDLNTLLRKRWKNDGNGNSTYINKTASTETEALNIILNERRKELPFNGNTRWEDLRRLNLDIRFAKSLTRTIAGVKYTLPANDPRYVLPIPPSEMNIRPLIQNPR